MSPRRQAKDLCPECGSAGRVQFRTAVLPEESDLRPRKTRQTKVLYLCVSDAEHNWWIDERAPNPPS